MLRRRGHAPGQDVTCRLAAGLPQCYPTSMGQMSDTLRGALLMMAAMAAFAGNDTIMKLVSTEVPLGQAIVLRGVVVALLVAVMVAAGPGFRAVSRLPKGRDGRLLLLRALAEILASLLFLTALAHMPLADLVAIMQSLPLVVTLLAALAFREPLGWRRLTAIGLGFAGMLVIIRPGQQGFDAWALVALAAMLAVAVRDLCSRAISAAVPSMALTFQASMVVLLLGFALLPLEGWVPVGPATLALLAAGGGFMLGGFVFIIAAMRAADVGAVAPFRYTSLLWAILLGWLVFDQLPDLATLCGGAIVVASGMFTLYRERRLRSGALRPARGFPAEHPGGVPARNPVQPAPAGPGRGECC